MNLSQLVALAADLKTSDIQKDELAEAVAAWLVAQGNPQRLIDHLASLCISMVADVMPLIAHRSRGLNSAAPAIFKAAIDHNHKIGGTGSPDLEKMQQRVDVEILRASRRGSDPVMPALQALAHLVQSIDQTHGEEFAITAAYIMDYTAEADPKLYKLHRDRFADLVRSWGGAPTEGSPI